MDTSKLAKTSPRNCQYLSAGDPGPLGEPTAACPNWSAVDREDQPTFEGENYVVPNLPRYRFFARSCRVRTSLILEARAFSTCTKGRFSYIWRNMAFRALAIFSLKACFSSFSLCLCASLTAFFRSFSASLARRLCFWSSVSSFSSFVFFSFLLPFFFFFLLSLSFLPADPLLFVLSCGMKPGVTR